MKASNTTAQEEHKQFWIVATPSKSTRYEELRRQLAGAATTVSKFNVPGLRVGTLDSLLTLSEDLGKRDTYLEQVCTKIARQLHDLYVDTESGRVDNHEKILSVNGAGLEIYLSQFQWDEAKYKLNSPLKDIVEAISQTISKLDEELRAKASAYQGTCQAIAAEKKKTTGNLIVRDLSDIVKKTDYVDTEYLTTLFVVVPKTGAKEWIESYETLVTDVVPRSSSLLHSDQDYNLYNVILFKKLADDFKTQARSKKWTVREFKFDEKAASAGQDELKKQESKKTKQRNNLIRWCRLNFAEAFIGWAHLKTVRVFVETVLRYGLPADFVATLIEVGKNGQGKIRKTLDTMYASLGSTYLDGGDEIDAASMMAGVGEKFYPYVFTKIQLSTVPQ